jgi:hypothetical protein
MDHSSGPMFPVTGLIMLTPLAIAATRYAFAKDEVLTSPAVAKIVGSTNPVVARVACSLGVLVCWPMVAMCVYTVVNRYVLGHG